MSTPQFKCPYCGATSAPIVKQKVSTGGWVLFVILLLFCFIFAWVPILYMKEDYRVCSACGMTLG